MAIYRNVNITFWTDTKVSDDFSPEDKYFMLYCLTNNYTNLCGCYEISIKQMSRDTGYNEETIEKLLERFKNVHKVIFYDKENKELLIKNWYKYNWTKSEKLDKPLLKEIENIKTVEFKKVVADEYNKRDTVSIPYIYPMDTTVTASVSDTVSDTVTETDSEIAEITKCYEENIEILELWETQFNEFYSKYPKKVQKQNVKKWFKKNNPNDELFNIIMNKLEEFKQSNNWKKDNGQYIPYPTTWLNQKRWEDETEKPQKDEWLEGWLKQDD